MLYYYRRQLKVALLVLLLIGLAYGGVKALMYHNVTRALEDIEIAATGRAQISHGDIDTDIRGEVRLHDLQILPTGAPEPIRIELARLTGPHAGYFIWHGDEQKPARLRLELIGIHIGLQPAMFDAMKQQMTLPASAATGDGCGSEDGIDPALMRKLGMTELAMDLNLSYDYDAERRQLAMAFGMDLQGVENVQAALTLGDVAPAVLQGDSTPETLPTLVGMSLDMHVAPAFAERYLTACAQRRGQDLASYRQSLVDEARAGMALAGLRLGPGLSEALDRYYREWGDLHIAAQPTDPVNLLGLLFADPANWQRQLGFELAINGRPITDLSFTLKPADADELAVMMGKQPPARPKIIPRDRYRYVYHRVPVSALREHIGAEIRLELRNDQPSRSGVLVGIAGNEARVEQRLHGGKITAHVPLDEIAALEVRQVEKIPAQ